MQSTRRANGAGQFWRAPMTRKVTGYHVLAIAGLLALAGCAAIPPPAAPTPVSLESPDDLRRTADEYSKLADTATGTERAELQLRAAETLLQGDDLASAKRIVEPLDPRTLTPRQLIRRQLLIAHIAFEERDTRRVIKALDFALTPDMTPATRAEIHRLRANAYALEGHLAESLQERIALEPLLSDPDEVRATRESIWQGMMILPADVIDDIRNQFTPPLVDGWFELAHISRVYRQQPDEFGMRMLAWRQQFPDHPAAAGIVPSLQALQTSAGARPARFALLLPLTGQFGPAATALRDGFVSAYFERADKTYQPSIQVYDIGGDNPDVRAIYQQAVSDGADFVVGPLAKNHVTALAGLAELPVPVLALNTVDPGITPPGNLYQFGLAPEDDARHVAERAWLDGHRQPLAIVPSGEWGERVLAAFKERWQQLGGTAPSAQDYDPQASDYSTMLKGLFNIDQSEARHRTLRRQTGLDIKYEPRRRQDVDFIFLAAFPRQGRLIQPQIKFHRGTGLPVYATSHIYTGAPDQALDRDLEDITFCDSAWVLAQPQADQPLQQAVLRLWPEVARSYLRFYALGIDAFNIPGNLQHLRAYPYERYDGVTGNLFIDGANQFHRQLAWASFHGGRPRLLETGLVIPP
ncbi:MAG: LppC family lipoprotein [Gammaproteobacteria bacterium]|nr:MAG: LppC family lipoprotein [Gammaproteobacteria bacterium]TND02698.1 MAG: LppC family lipoprotein [Gammaproteobacteria bacterium]